MLLGPHSFLRKFLLNPKGTGALAPATRSLARSVGLATHEAYQHQLRRADGARLKLIELGAGTGALTRTLRAFNPVLVERDAGWARLLREEFPTLEVRWECATQTLRDLSEPVGVVTSIPLLNNSQSAELKALVARRYAEGLIKFCVLYTYGLSNPMAEAGFRHARRRRFVAGSFPPASVWVYR